MLSGAMVSVTRSPISRLSAWIRLAWSTIESGTS
jgi:hypothetical protein